MNGEEQLLKSSALKGDRLKIFGHTTMHSEPDTGILPVVKWFIPTLKSSCIPYRFPSGK